MTNPGVGKLRPGVQPIGDSFYLFTSISPRLHGDDLERQKSCIKSWKEAGFTVATVNGPAEAAHITNFGLDIEILAAPADGKPRIADLLRAIAEKNCHYAGIINADCSLLPYPKLSDRLVSCVEKRLVFAERIDVDDRLRPQPDACGGFDAFFFDTKIIPSDLDITFRMGVPWWDYWFPLVAVANGIPIGNLEAPLLTHKAHERTWNDAEHHSIGRYFWRILRGWHSQQPNFPALGPEVDRLWAQETLTVEQLEAVGSACYRWLHSRRLEFHLLPAEMARIEAILCSTRAAFKIAAERQGELHHAGIQFVELQAALAKLQAEVTEYWRPLVLKLQAANTKLQAANTKLQAANEYLEYDVSTLKRGLSQMEGSTSWRVTKPVRKIGSIVRKFYGRD